MTTPVSSDSPDLLNYTGAQAHVDEVYTPTGEQRPYWQRLLNSFSRMGSTELISRQQKAQRILRDDGASYISAERPAEDTIWELDPIPVLLGSEEWAKVERGLRERAELLDLVLKDLYGERRLIRAGILPPELLFGFKGFIRACHDLRLPSEHQLIFHSSDLIRRADGSFCVLTDRTQIPRGIGYALENRNVMTRVFPNLFHESQVRRIGVFYQSLRQSLDALAPDTPNGRPCIVVMTPGAHSHAYFEHISLANYLGYPLVQGGDLTVRSGHVWMKSVSGLNRVDVILRFVDDRYCDPVELRCDSHLGVAGLLEAARSGGVVVVNPIGTGLLENPALLKYMPQISEYFLGRRLELDSVDTFWCGDPADLAYVKEHFRDMVIKPLNRIPNQSSAFICELPEQEQAQWLEKVQANPAQYVAQAYIDPSQSPTLVAGGLQPRRILMRSFALANNDSYCLMPGSLTRVARDRPAPGEQNTQGALSKDTWVLATEPDRAVIPPQKVTAPVPERRAERLDLPSRVVENLFWFGRYSERAEITARMLRTAFLQLNSTLQLPPDVRRLILFAVTEITTTHPGFQGKEAAKHLDNPDAELLSVILDRQRTGSLRHSMLAMLNCAEEVKEQLSTDAQRIINDLRDQLNSLDHALSGGVASAPEAALDPIVTGLLAMAGQSHESIFRGIGWRFLEMGRRLEKAYQCAALIRALLVDCFSGRAQEIALETLLISNEALISYRRLHLVPPEVYNGLHLMLIEDSNPRSLLFLLQDLRKHLDSLSEEFSQRGLTAGQKQLLSATTLLQLADIDALAAPDHTGTTRTQLDELLATLQGKLGEVADHISNRYFDHTAGPQQLVQADWENEI